MKKWIKDVIITVISMAIICAVFWKIDWISSWKEVAAIYGIMVMVIAVNTILQYIGAEIKKRIDRKE